MNVTSILQLALAVIAAAGLSVTCVVLQIRRYHREMKWLDKLWADHAAITSAQPDDLKRRKELREEMRDVSGLTDRKASSLLHYCAMTFLIVMQVGIVWWLAHRTGTGSTTPEFWVLIAFLFISLVSTVILALHRRED